MDICVGIQVGIGRYKASIVLDKQGPWGMSSQEPSKCGTGILAIGYKDNMTWDDLIFI